MNAMQDKVMALEMALPLLSEKDRAFADSLINGKYGFKARGALSANQAPWVDKLLARAMGDEPKPAAVQVGSMAGLYAIFQKAKSALKFPKIRLQVNGKPVALSMAGAKSKNPGAINVTNGAKYGDPSNKFYGVVNADGSFKPGYGAHAEQADVIALLQDMAKDAAAAASKYGKLTGYCCFCNLPLSDPQSTAAGFGETCAKNWGLLAQYKSAEQVL